MKRVESLKNFQEEFPKNCADRGRKGRELVIVGFLEEIAGSLAVIADALAEQKDGEDDERFD